MFNKIIVKVDKKHRTVMVKRGLFGTWSQFSGDFWGNYSIREIVRIFQEREG